MTMDHVIQTIDWGGMLVCVLTFSGEPWCAIVPHESGKRLEVLVPGSRQSVPKRIRRALTRWPATTPQLAARAGCHRSTANRVLLELEASGVAVRRGRSAHGTLWSIPTLDPTL